MNLFYTIDLFVLFHIMKCFPNWSNVLTNIDEPCSIFEERVWFQDSPEHFLGDRKNNIFGNPHCLRWLIHLTSEKERRKPTIKYVGTTNTTTISLILQNLSLNNLLGGKKSHPNRPRLSQGFPLPCKGITGIRASPLGALPLCTQYKVHAQGSQGYLSSKVPTSGIV